ncbi:PepSY domain-containing protein [Paenibacillus residui]|jgi:uncharacterized membrane protein YkoI|uniref:PepSY domain-containing protein n=1 Tax=Paenibacillus residui TaxID=629724 RepID=A0ABW3DG74_9BACL
MWRWIGAVSLSALLIALLALGMKWPIGAAPADLLAEQEIREAVLNQYPGEIRQVKLQDKAYNLELEYQGGIYRLEVDGANGNITALEILEPAASPWPTEQEPSPGTAAGTNTEPMPGQTNGEGEELSSDQIRAIIQSEAAGDIQFFKRIYQNGNPVYKAIVKRESGKAVIMVDALTGKVLLSKETSSAATLTEQEAIAIALSNVQGKVEDADLKETDSAAYYLVEIETDDEREATVQIHAVSGEVMSITWDD